MASGLSLDKFERVAASDKDGLLARIQRVLGENGVLTAADYVAELLAVRSEAKAARLARSTTVDRLRAEVIMGGVRYVDLIEDDQIHVDSVVAEIAKERGINLD